MSGQASATGKGRMVTRQPSRIFKSSPIPHTGPNFNSTETRRAIAGYSKEMPGSGSDLGNILPSKNMRGFFFLFRCPVLSLQRQIIFLCQEPHIHHLGRNHLGRLCLAPMLAAKHGAGRRPEYESDVTANSWMPDPLRTSHVVPELETIRILLETIYGTLIGLAARPTDVSSTSLGR